MYYKETQEALAQLEKNRQCIKEIGAQLEILTQLLQMAFEDVEGDEEQ